MVTLLPAFAKKWMLFVAFSLIKNLLHLFCMLRNTDTWRILHGGVKILILFLSGKTIFYSLAVLVRKILFLPRENKIHIFAPPCNVLFII